MSTSTAWPRARKPTAAMAPTPRHLLTELGEIALAVPRTRRFAPIAVLRARRPEQVDRMILSCFVLGLSVRKVGEALLALLGRPISPATREHGRQAA